MLRRKVVQRQTQTQVEAAPHPTPPPGEYFPWTRLLIALGIIVLLVFLFVITIVVTRSVAAIIASACGLIIAIIAVLQYFFPLHPVARSHNSAPDALPASHPSEITPAAQPPQSPGASSLPPVAQGKQVAQSVPVAQTVQVVQASHIFHCNEPLPRPDAFFGREYERRELIQRTSIRASTAVDGEYRAGKSWLLQYLQQVAPTHPQLGTHVKIGKLSATHPQCQTVEGFVKRALETLNLSNHDGIHARKLQLAQLAVAMKDCKKLGIIPVLCIDEFAGLIGKPGFDTTFLNQLRSIAEDDGLVLITASRQPLHEVIEQMTGQTSPLFNIMPRLHLKPFTEPEARAFIDSQGQQAGFDRQEQAFFLECAAIHAPDSTKGWPPLRLQLVGKMLYDARFKALAEGKAPHASDATYSANFKQELYEQYMAMVKYP